MVESSRFTLLLLALVAKSVYALPATDTATTAAGTSSITSITKAQWSSLNSSVHNRLFAGKPFVLPCYTSYDNGFTTQPNVPNLPQCSVALEDRADPVFIAGQFGAYQNGNIGRCMSKGLGCPPVVPPANGSVTPIADTCHQGSVPNYYVDAKEVSDVQAAIKFAKQYKLRLVVKNSGHDYKGRSAGPNSLAIWVHNIKPTIKLDKNFTPDCCPKAVGPTLTYGAGQDMDGIYSAAHKNGYMAVGGLGGTVGASGGWVAGGGHSILTPTHGLGVDNVQQMRVVLPDGSLVTANRCENQDIFFALRGGGGGTFGVIVETTSTVYKEVPLQYAEIQIPATIKGKDITDMLVANAAQWAKDGWGGYFQLGAAAGSGSVFTAINPELSLSDAKKSMKPFTTGVFANAAVVNITTVPDYWAYYNIPFVRNLAAITNGLSSAISSRLIPKANFATAAKREELSKTLSNMAMGIMMVGPASYDLPATDKKGGVGEASVTPAWRDALWHAFLQVPWATEDPTANTPQAIATAYKTATQMADPIRKITPGSGAYQNEADTFEPDFTNSFWGADNYKRLLKIKKQVDPSNLFTCHQCVGYDENDGRYECYPDV